ncbi:hypothetical protein ACEN85_19940, partial [Curtobacterium sp. CT11-45]
MFIIPWAAAGPAGRGRAPTVDTASIVAALVQPVPAAPTTAAPSEATAQPLTTAPAGAGSSVASLDAPVP